MKKMSPGEALARLRELSGAVEPEPASANPEATRVLCELLNYCGHSKIVDEWKKVNGRTDRT